MILAADDVFLDDRLLRVEPSLPRGAATGEAEG
jgi:hypothetical protein